MAEAGVIGWKPFLSSNQLLMYLYSTPVRSAGGATC